MCLLVGCLTHKYVDHTTMTEVLGRSAVSSVQSFVDELVQQATEAGMIVNNVNVNVIVVLNANVLRLDEDRRQRRSGISFWT